MVNFYQNYGPPNQLEVVPKNPSLYWSLASRFDPVRITNAGNEAEVTETKRRVAGKLFTATKYVGGEHYHINCPRCGDQRLRLAISHRYGTPDDKSGRRIDHVLLCHNEDCFATPESRDWFTVLLSRPPRQPIARQAVVPVSSSPTPQAENGQLPEGFLPLSQLPHNHRACDYLRSRGFDPVMLAEQWRIGFVARSLRSTPKFFNRIVIPVHQPALSGAGGSVPVGWQARKIDDRLPDSPKYLNCSGFKKSAGLSGLAEAAGSSGPVVLVEGISDVWPLGFGAVASFGRTLSRAQVQMLVQHFPGRPIVVGYDRDASDEAQVAARKIRSARREIGDDTPVLVCPPPSGYKDFGECSPEVGAAEVWRTLTAHQIKVSSAHFSHQYAASPILWPAPQSLVAIAYPMEGTSQSAGSLYGDRAGIMGEDYVAHILHASPAEMLGSCPSRIYFDSLKSLVHERACGYPAPTHFEDVRVALHLLDENTGIEIDRVVTDLFADPRQPERARSNSLGTQALATHALWADGELFSDLKALTLSHLYNEVEKPCIPALAAMMHRGLLIDLAGLQAAVTNCVIPDTVIGTANSILKLTNPATGRVHCDFSVTSAVTGRITASRPNLQSYPNALKQFAVAPAGCVLVEADCSQQEPRVRAELAGDTFSKEQFSKGVDYHRTTAATLLNKSVDAISNEERQLGKKFNLAMSYGSTVPGLAKVLGTTRAETIRYIDAFNAAHPAIQPWRQTIVSHLREHRFVRTLFGRRRRLPAIASDNPAEVAKAERQAVNAVIQGTAAEIMKLALARLHTALPADCHLVLTVHDSVLVECPIEREAEVRDLLLKVMRQPPVDSWLPLEVSIKSGTCWGTMN
jgi:hypothetical protein